MSYVIRNLQLEDIPRVMSDWLRSYRREKELRHVPNPVYFHYHHALVGSLITDERVLWGVVCPSDQPNLIAGFCAAEPLGGGPLLVHYVYVSKTFRRLGLGSRMLATLGVMKDTPVMVTHHSYPGEQLLKSRGNVGLYNPYLAFGRTPVAAPVVGKRCTAAWRKAVAKEAKNVAAGHNQSETAGERDAKP